MKNVYSLLTCFLFASVLNAQMPTLQWAKQLGGSAWDNGESIAVDAAGYVYTTGFFEGTADFDPGPGVFNLTAAGNVGNSDVFVSKLDAAGNFVWAKRFGGGGTEFCYSIAVDATGNVYTTGRFGGTVDFDPGPGVFNLTAVKGGAFISKLDNNGNFIWAKQMAGNSDAIGRSIVVDAGGNVYTTGYFFGTVDFDPGAGAFNLTSEGDGDVFIAKLSEAGNFVWAKRMGSSGGDIAVDGAGNVYTTGNFSGTVDFDPGLSTFNLTSAGIVDIFISKLDATGDFVWAKRVGGSGGDGDGDDSNSIALDAVGNIYTTGYFSGSVDFDPGPGVFNLVSAGSVDVFILKLDAAGDFIWSKRLGGVDADYGYSLALDRAGNVYTTGSLSGTASFGSEVVIPMETGRSDAFVLKLNGAGNFEWIKRITGLEVDTYVTGRDIAVDGANNIYTTGTLGAPADFDPGPETYTPTWAGAVDAFVVKWSQSVLCTPPTFLNNAGVTINPICNPNNGQITITPQSGIAPFQYSINGGTTYVSGPSTGFTFANLAAGTYQLRLKEANGCESAIISSTIVTAECILSPPPTITSFSPLSGPVGTTVTITGTNFSPVAANNIVYFGAVRASVTAATSTTLTLEVPVGATYQPLSVTTGRLTGYSSQPFVATFPVIGNGFTSVSFKPKVDFPVAVGPRKMAIVDLDGDGRPDMVTTSVDANSISVLRNVTINQTLSFSSKIDFQTGASPFQIAVGDLDGDGKPDLAVLKAPRSISLFKNVSTLGNINFAPRIDLTVVLNESFGVSDISIADLDGDGRPDIAVNGGFFQVPQSGAFSVFRNISEGGTLAFEPRLEFEVPYGSNAVIGDLNGDGKPDLIAQGTNSISVFRNSSTSGTITFAAKTDYPLLPNTRQALVGDVDGDGLPDIVALSRGFISVLRNTSTTGTLSFAEKTDVPTSVQVAFGESMALGDLDGDGKLDLVRNYVIDNPFVYIHKNVSSPGAPAFAAEVGYQTSFALFNAAIGDLNGDGRADIATPNSSVQAITVLVNQAPPSCATFNTSFQNATCGDNDGTINVIPTTGTAPLYSLDGGATYEASPYATGFTKFNLQADTYQLRLKDANGCESQVVVRTVGAGNCPPNTCDLPRFSQQANTVVGASCGASNGQLSIVPISGNAPFEYSIDGGATYVSGSNNGYTFTNLAAGKYELRLKDAGGCESLVVERFVQSDCPPTNCTAPTLLNTLPIVGHAYCGLNEGQIVLIPTSGTAPFLFSINGGLSYVAGPDQGYTFTNLAPGMYQLKIKDATGCESVTINREVEARVCVTQNRLGVSNINQSLFTPDVNKTALKVMAFPNPSKGRFRLQVLQSASSKAELFIYDGKGTLVQQSVINPNNSNTIEVNLTGKAKGLYHIKVVNSIGLTTTRVLIH